MPISFSFVCTALLLVLSIVCSHPVLAAEKMLLSPKECEALGFRSNEVQCRYCDLLKQQTQNNKLYGECTACCVERTIELTSSSATVPYTIAQFSLQNHKYYVETKFIGNTLYDFIEKFKDQPYFSQIQYVDSTQTIPRLILWNAEMTKKLEVRIAGWSPDSMDKFIREKLTVTSNSTSEL